MAYPILCVKGQNHHLLIANLIEIIIRRFIWNIQSRVNKNTLHFLVFHNRLQGSVPSDVTVQPQLPTGGQTGGQPSATFRCPHVGLKGHPSRLGNHHQLRQLDRHHTTSAEGFVGKLVLSVLLPTLWKGHINTLDFSFACDNRRVSNIWAVWQMVGSVFYPASLLAQICP